MITMHIRTVPVVGSANIPMPANVKIYRVSSSAAIDLGYAAAEGTIAIATGTQGYVFINPLQVAEGDALTISGTATVSVLYE